MPETDWSQVENLFHQARELPLVLRERFLAELAPELRALVSELLNCDSGGEETLFQTIESAAALFSRPGEKIGNWKLVRPLGEGGMGSVYLGVRTDGTFDRNVAIKFVRRGMDSPALRLRLEAERRILARLDHPNIARLLDAGATPEGQPYLVMDYVQGRSIIDYVAQQDLTVRQRVALFLQVCSAVDYAHRNLVVHRDLKPGNILVDASGTVRLLDFGIAKLLDPSLAPSGVTQLRLMSFEWASPEQIRGESATTATDVYSLGAVLYQVLSGQLPFKVEGLSTLEAERLIFQTTPPPPGSLNRQIGGDLNNIVLKALRHEPSGRYQSVAELAADLRRYLAGEAVEAREYSTAERTAIFIRRHRVPAAAAAVAILSLVGGTGLAVRYAVQAHHERAVAISERARAEGERERAQAQSDEAARQEKLAESKETDAQLQRAAAEAQRLIAERSLHSEQQVLDNVVSGVYQYIATLQGATEARLNALRSVIPVLEKRTQDQPSNTLIASLLARSYQRMGELFSGGSGIADPKAALPWYEKSLSIMEGLAKREPYVADHFLALSIIQGQTATLLAQMSTGDAAAARAIQKRFADSIGFARKAGGLAPHQVEIPARLADALTNRLMSNSQKPDQAFVADLTELRQLCEKDLADHPSDPDAFDRAGRLEALESIYQNSRGNFVGAVAATERALAHREKALTARPRDAQFLRAIMITSSNLANGYRRTEGPKSPKIAAAYERMTAIAEKLAAIDPEDRNARYDLAMAMQRLGTFYSETDRIDAAVIASEKSLQLLRDLRRHNDLTTARLRNLNLAIMALGNVYARGHRTEDAVRTWTEALRESETLLATDTHDGVALSTASQAALRLARNEAPGHIDLAHKAVTYAERLAKDNPTPAQQVWLARARGMAALVLAQANDTTEAARLVGLATESMTKIPEQAFADWPAEERAQVHALARRLATSPSAAL